jgi:hypothetical protein
VLAVDADFIERKMRYYLAIRIGSRVLPLCQRRRREHANQ